MTNLLIYWSVVWVAMLVVRGGSATAMVEEVAMAAAEEAAARQCILF
jgi:hypothetical protein